MACLYLNVDSSLVDFNIHPAKKEAKFKDLAPIHKSVSTAVKTFFTTDALNAAENLSIKKEEVQKDLFFPKPESPDINQPFTSQKRSSFFSDSFTNDTFEKSQTDTKPASSMYDAKTLTSSFPSHNFRESQKKNSDFSFSETKPDYAKNSDYNFKYLGTALGTFLIAEYNGLLYFIDQHAAHERILFNKFMETSGQKQALLISYVIETQSQSDDDYLESIKEKLSDCGFDIENAGEGRWEISSVPVSWQGTEKDLCRDILTDKKPPDQIIRKIAASCACRSAVMDGTLLDSEQAKKIIDGAFKLDDPHCPHGRPVWKVFTKAELFQMVRRT